VTSPHLATEPIVSSDDAIAEAIRTANVLAVVASVVHLTGDAGILRGPIRPRRLVFNELDGGLTEDEQAELRRCALPVVAAFRDRGSVPPPAPHSAVIRELMDWLAAAPVEDEYAELFLEEMDLHGNDPRRIDAPPTQAVSVLVIGCGVSGLLAGIRLQQAGIPFEIVEKNDDVGGTWYENTYPGCRVDVANHYYCYSFEPNNGFSEFFSQQPELHAYFREVMNRHGVDRHVRWGTEVERAVWEDDRQRWRVTLRARDGNRSETTVSAIISAVGQLNRPSIPDLPHLERFRGPVFHSARWDGSVDVRGKRVALIGAGASGFQIGPAIVDSVEHLVVFQRSAQWMLPNRLYHEAVGSGSRWAMGHLPGYTRWYRFLLLWQATDKMLDIARVDPTWHGLPGSVNPRSERFRQTLLRWIEEQLGDRPDLLA
jgi:4-hydroxyacetophenone monooxygenase